MNCFLYLPKLKEADARQRLNHRLCPPLPKATFVVRSTGGKNRELLSLLGGAGGGHKGPGHFQPDSTHLLLYITLHRPTCIFLNILPSKYYPKYIRFGVRQANTGPISQGLWTTTIRSTEVLKLHL